MHLLQQETKLIWSVNIKGGLEVFNQNMSLNLTNILKILPLGAFSVCHFLNALAGMSTLPVVVPFAYCAEKNETILIKQVK